MMPLKSSVLNLAKRRRSVRRFQKTQVDLGSVLTALEAACQAPSGANSQPWRFLVVTDHETKRRIREVCEKAEMEFYSKVVGHLKTWLLAKGLNWSKPFLEEAPLLVLIFSETKASYSTESVWLSIGYILLALEENGLSTLTYTPSGFEDASEHVGAPKGFKLEAILPIGIEAGKRPKEPRLDPQEVIYLDCWGRKLDPHNLSTYNVR